MGIHVGGMSVLGHINYHMSHCAGCVVEQPSVLITSHHWLMVVLTQQTIFNRCAGHATVARQHVRMVGSVGLTQGVSHVDSSVCRVSHGGYVHWVSVQQVGLTHWH